MKSDTFKTRRPPKPKPREKKTTRADLSARELAQLVKRVEQLEAQVDVANTRAGTAHDRCSELDERCNELQDSLDGLLEAHDDEIIAAITAKQLLETGKSSNTVSVEDNAPTLFGLPVTNIRTVEAKDLENLQKQLDNEAKEPHEHG